MKHFEKDTPKAQILCKSCKQPLWELVVRSKKDKLISTFHKPIGNNVAMMGKDNECPLCGLAFDDKGKFLFRSPLTGRTFVA